MPAFVLLALLDSPGAVDSVNGLRFLLLGGTGVREFFLEGERLGGGVVVLLEVGVDVLLGRRGGLSLIEEGALELVAEVVLLGHETG